jgi:hypothetical protein
MLSRFLKAIHEHPFWGCVGLLAYAALATFPHQPVQWLMNEIALRSSRPTVYLWSARIGAVEVLVLTAVVIFRLRKQEGRFVIAISWIVTFALILLTWHTFTANELEFVHYPQYIPEGVILVALTLSPAESLCWVVILGGLDEAFQYAVLSRLRAAPYDFNDVFMDLLGGAAGVLLGMVFLRCTRRDQPVQLRKRPGIIALLGIVGTGIVLWATGFMLLFEDKTDTRHWFSLSRFKAPAFWFMVVENGPNKYHTLSPVEGPILILATIALYSIIDHRLKISPVK